MAKVGLAWDVVRIDREQQLAKFASASPAAVRGAHAA
jgi:hypothetical protein